jgi:SulP family sulfate permease
MIGSRCDSSFSLHSHHRQLQFGPETIISIIYGNNIQQFVGSYAQDSQQYVDIAALLSMMTGLCVLSMGLLRLGFMEAVLSHSVVSGE